MRVGKISKEFEKWSEESKCVDFTKCFVVYYGNEFKLRSLSVVGKLKFDPYLFYLELDLGITNRQILSIFVFAQQIQLVQRNDTWALIENAQFICLDFSEIF